MEEVIAYANTLDLSMYTDESTLNLNRMLVYAAQTLADEEATQEEVDAMTTSVQEAIDALVPVSDASVNGAGTSASAGNASGSVTNTSAQTQTILFAGVLAAAACGALFAGIRRRQHSA